jgi:hypothetical protein
MAVIGGTPSPSFEIIAAPQRLATLNEDLPPANLAYAWSSLPPECPRNGIAAHDALHRFAQFPV